MSPDERTASRFSFTMAAGKWHEEGICSLARVLREFPVIFWDEISMTPKKWTLDANEPLFGGKIMIAGGEFRQVLPVMGKERQEDLKSACAKVTLWRHFLTYPPYLYQYETYKGW
ncbi:hypothetical protein OSTOST_21680 [Ostertagia ostertagi]